MERATVYKGATRNRSQEWGTPRPLFRKLHEEFNFTVDVAASELNHLLPTYYTKENSGLVQAWMGRAYCNPPFDDIAKWLKKAIGEIGAGNAELAVFLLPVRTDTRWFQSLAYPHASEIRFIRGRLKFWGSRKGTQAPFPTMLVILKRGSKPPPLMSLCTQNRGVI